ncbi:MAG TPA: RNA polymerase subunit sigma [Clostridiales bacterium]|nr:RNA polymerase subunit sigma [Clostridiales bacterium]
MTELEQIYNRYFKDVYLFTLGLSKDKHVAEDITSETFMKAIKAIDSFNGDCDIRVWLCQIAKNAYISYVRKNKKQVNVESIPEQKDDMDVERIVFSSVEAMKVHKILHKLEEPYKEVFSLRVFGELSFKQIADVFGKTDNWACVTFHRAKGMIVKEMR